MEIRKHISEKQNSGKPAPKLMDESSSCNDHSIPHGSGHVGRFYLKHMDSIYTKLSGLDILPAAFVKS